MIPQIIILVLSLELLFVSVLVFVLSESWSQLDSWNDCRTLYIIYPLSRDRSCTLYWLLIPFSCSRCYWMLPYLKYFCRRQWDMAVAAKRKTTEKQFHNEVKFFIKLNLIFCKAQVFWKSHKIWKNMPLFLKWQSGRFFFKFFGTILEYLNFLKSHLHFNVIFILLYAKLNF